MSTSNGGAPSSAMKRKSRFLPHGVDRSKKTRTSPDGFRLRARRYRSDDHVDFHVSSGTDSEEPIEIDSKESSGNSPHRLISKGYDSDVEIQNSRHDGLRPMVGSDVRRFFELESRETDRQVDSEEDDSDEEVESIHDARGHVHGDVENSEIEWISGCETAMDGARGLNNLKSSDERINHGKSDGGGSEDSEHESDGWPRLGDAREADKNISTDDGHEAVMGNLASLHGQEVNENGDNDMEEALQAIENSHERLLSIRRQTPQILAHRNGIHRLNTTADNPDDSDKDPQSDEELARVAWLKYLSRLSNDDFNSKKLFASDPSYGRARYTGFRHKRLALVNGIGINEFNNLDVAAIHSQRCGPYAEQAKIDTYRLIRGTLGQYCKVYLTFNASKRKRFCERGQLFEALRNCRLITRYLNKYRIDASPTTVCSKANHLVVAAKAALNYYATANKPQEKGEIITIISYLQNTSAKYKSEHRYERKFRIAAEARLKCSKLLVPNDFDHCVSRAESHLNAVIRKVDGTSILQHSPTQLSASQKLIDKWFLNFTALLMFVVGADLKIYSHLVTPNEADLDRMQSDSQSDFIELEVDSEFFPERTRPPKLLLPKKMLRYIRFHIDRMLPWLTTAHRSDAADGASRLLLHTQTGETLSPHQMVRTLRVFVGGYDRDFSGITPSAFRGSYAAMMMNRYLSGEIFVAKPEREYLDFLADTMNASRAELENEYASARSRDFHDLSHSLTVTFLREEFQAPNFLRQENRVRSRSGGSSCVGPSDRSTLVSGALLSMWN